MERDIKQPTGIMLIMVNHHIQDRLESAEEDD